MKNIERKKKTAMINYEKKERIKNGQLKILI